MRDRLACLVLMSAALVLINGGDAAVAQPTAAPIQLFTVEAQAMLSEVVVRGEIAAVEGPRVKVTAQETFRGPDKRVWDVVWTDTIPAAQVGHECLVFINPVDDGRNRDLHATGCIPLDGSGRAYDVSLREISSRDDLLRAVRDVRDATAPLVYVFADAPSADQPGPNFVVPKLRRLETLAQDWLRSPEDRWQWTGISVVSHFRSPENLERLKALLSDTTFEYGSGSGRWKSGTYVKREYALNVINLWQEPIAQVSAAGPVLFHQPVPEKAAGWFGGAIVLWVVSVAVVGRMWRRRAGMPFRVGSFVGDGITAFLLVAAILMGWLWRRSHAVVDEVVFGVGRTHHEIGSYRGGIQYVLIRDWEWDARFRYGVFAPTRPMDLSKPPVPWRFGPGRPVPGWMRPMWPPNVARYRYGHESPQEDAWNLDAYSLTTNGQKWGLRWGSGSEQTHQGPLLNYKVVRIPYAWVLPFASIVPLMRLPAWVRRWRRLRKGLCPQCGYDVRVTPDACPECGWQRRTKTAASPAGPAPAPHVQSV